MTADTPGNAQHTGSSGAAPTDSRGDPRGRPGIGGRPGIDGRPGMGSQVDSARETATEDAAYAMTQLYEQFRRPIHSYIYRLLGSQEDADDLTQEVFVRACIAWEQLYDRSRLSAWLYRIATNLSVDLLRRRKRISWWRLGRRYSDGTVEEGAGKDISVVLPDSGGIPEVAEREHIQLALAKMPHEYAVVLMLSAAQGIPYQEIARIIGVSNNAAATRISRAKKMFMEQYQRLSQEGVEV